MEFSCFCTERTNLLSDAGITDMMVPGATAASWRNPGHLCHAARTGKDVSDAS